MTRYSYEFGDYELDADTVITGYMIWCAGRVIAWTEDRDEAERIVAALNKVA